MDNYLWIFKLTEFDFQNNLIILKIDLFFYIIYMRDKLKGEQKYINLTPQIAWEYLRFKKEYEGKDFLSIWESIVPTYFSASEFCDYINTLRIQRKDFANKGKEKAKIAFNKVFNELLWNKIQYQDIDKRSFKQLVGTLMNAVKKINTLTENASKDMVQVLQELEGQKAEKKEAILKKERTKIEQEVIVDEVLNNIFIDLRSQKEYNKPVGE